MAWASLSLGGPRVRATSSYCWLRPSDYSATQGETRRSLSPLPSPVGERGPSAHFAKLSLQASNVPTHLFLFLNNRETLKEGHRKAPSLQEEAWVCFQNQHVGWDEQGLVAFWQLAVVKFQPPACRSVMKGCRVGPRAFSPGQDRGPALTASARATDSHNPLQRAGRTQCEPHGPAPWPRLGAWRGLRGHLFPGRYNLVL